MSLISEIREKSKSIDAPSLVISKSEQDLLCLGKVLIITCIKTNKKYRVRLSIDKICTSIITKEDLEIEQEKVNE